MIINPTRRDNFMPFFYAKLNNISFNLDNSYQKYNIPVCSLKQALIENIINAGFKNMKEVLGEIKDFNDDIIFSVLYSNPRFVSIAKDDENLKGILCYYNGMALKYEGLIKEYQGLKKCKESSQTLKSASDQIKAEHVITRFPPEPSGYLHIGHAKAALLNEFFAKQQGGTLLIRFDDTNPLNEEQEYVDAILEDIKLLQIEDYKLSYTSDYFDKIIQYAEYMIETKNAYVDNTEKEIMRKERMDGIESKCRKKSATENMEIFQRMKNGECKEYCLRAKMDMCHLNKALRDPVIFRTCDKVHHRVGDKYKIFPTYDFACPCVDTIEKVTHALRTNEYRDRNEQYLWVLKMLSVAVKPKIKDFSRLSFEGTVLSKRKLKKIVNEHGVKWNDPRMPTIRGIVRLGMDIGVLREYILLQGVSQKNCKTSWDKIWSMNKKKMENNSGKYFGITKEDLINARIENYDELVTEIKLSAMLENLTVKGSKVSTVEEKDNYKVYMPLNKKNSGLGSKEVNISKNMYLPKESYIENEEITLMGLGNFIVKSTSVGFALTFNKNGDFKSTRLKVQWISRQFNKECTMVEYGNLCKNEEGEYNENSKSESEYICEYGICNVNCGDMIQIERVGFFYCDEKEFNLVPYTKQARKK